MRYATTAELFAIDTKDHRLEIAQDDGLYRHLKFRAHDDQGQFRLGAWFDLITVPGTLTFVGDHDAVVFRRLPDMFEFFRGHTAPNLGYWAEKVVSGRANVRGYSEDAFTREVTHWVTSDIRDGNAPRGIGRAIRRDLFEAWHVDLTTEQGAREALADFEHEGYEFAFEDTAEWDLTDFTHQYRWACNAIVLGIRMYDAAKAAPAAA